MLGNFTFSTEVCKIQWLKIQNYEKWQVPITTCFRFGVCVQFYRPVLAPRAGSDEDGEMVVAFMLTTFCIITHHTFFNSIKECIHAFKLMFMKVFIFCSLVAYIHVASVQCTLVKHVCTRAKHEREESTCQ